MDCFCTKNKLSGDRLQSGAFLQICFYRYIALFSGVLFLLTIAGPVFSSGQIYSWTDSEGVRHYSNKPPPGMEAGRLSTTDEIPFDPEADEKREFQERQWQEQRAADDMEERLTEAEKKAAQAKRQAEESARKAEKLERELEAVREEQRDSDRVYVPVRPYRPYRPHPRPPVHKPGKPGKPGKPQVKPLPRGNSSVRVTIEKK